jgi:hypothetical protein
MIVIIAALMFLIPNMKKEQAGLLREVQEDEKTVQEMDMDRSHTYKITFQATTPDEDAIADIMWMKRAAEVARDAGIPYFNILEQKTQERFVKRYRTKLTMVMGVIQLDKDPMRAEYDASVIEDLVLSEQP